MNGQCESNQKQEDVKMGTGESSQSSELVVTTGLANQSTFNRQSPNVARLIRSETSSKMEYEFPITDVSSSSSAHHHHTSNHTIIPGNSNRTPLHHTNSLSTQQPINHSSHFLGNNDAITHAKLHSNQTSNMWLTITSCFGCRKRGSTNSSMNSLRDKVHAIRIVRASNDLTPAVFDSHYNIITLEQLRECDNNANSLSNEFTDVLPSQTSNPGAAAQNGNGSVVGSSSVKKDSSHRLKKKKKKRAAQTTSTSKTTGSDDDDDEGSERTYQ